MNSCAVKSALLYKSRYIFEGTLQYICKLYPLIAAFPIQFSILAMAIVCSICQDSLAERPQILSAREELTSVSLRCGHLFHGACISQWFTRQLAAACPYCCKISSHNGVLRVYPTWSQDDNGIVQQARELQNVTAENQKLLVDMSQLRQQLEKDRVTIETLKTQQSKAASRMERRESREMEMTTAITCSLSSALEKSERERKEALQKLAKLEVKELESRKTAQRLQKENEKLKREADRMRENMTTHFVTS
ncbi:E3 ubiquitin-protein ligase TRAIP [Orchesella cincta]|uniref:E3 ubiquitin-protein ligase TRAIP n=1 Tax=Orchesella cincta TaxID=48709 RepID=A0A1D2M3C9_ORCCI|nr:E3 ubiquitin-protein ligase TRAIP [Orchesella cincta]